MRDPLAERGGHPTAVYLALDHGVWLQAQGPGTSVPGASPRTPPSSERTRERDCVSAGAGRCCRWGRASFSTQVTPGVGGGAGTEDTDSCPALALILVASHAPLSCLHRLPSDRLEGRVIGLQWPPQHDNRWTLEGQRKATAGWGAGRRSSTQSGEMAAGKGSGGP